MNKQNICIFVGSFIATMIVESICKRKHDEFIERKMHRLGMEALEKNEYLKEKFNPDKRLES